MRLVPTLLIPALVAACIVSAACGRKGPPLPPLVRVPSPPGDFTAARRGSDIEIQFTVPEANTDGSKPANIQRIDIYAINGPAPARDADLLKQATRIATVDVKGPRDPNANVDPDATPDEIDPLEGTGLDQGVKARVQDRLTETPLPQFQGAEPSVRTYVGVGIPRKGRAGPASMRIAVPTGPAPLAPRAPTLVYTEQGITISWDPPSSSAGALQYFVYDISPGEVPTRLKDQPVATTTLADPRGADRMEWLAERCFTVTTYQTLGDRLGLESELSPTTCVTLIDTFPPKPPTGLEAVPAEGVVSLIWNGSTESDLAGYVVLRGDVAGGNFQPLTAEPIVEAHFEDSKGPRGQSFSYAVEAVDKAGNRSVPSERVEGTAR